jgi:hypothetical protein
MAPSINEHLQGVLRQYAVLSGNSDKTARVRGHRHNLHSDAIGWDRHQIAISARKSNYFAAHLSLILDSERELPWPLERITALSA